MPDELFLASTRSWLQLAEVEVEVTVDLHDLYQKIRRHFDQEELEELSFTLGVPYLDLSGQTHRAKTQSLVTFMDRHNKIPQLVETCKELRPAVFWTEAPATEPEQPNETVNSTLSSSDNEASPYNSLPESEKNDEADTTTLVFGIIIGVCIAVMISILASREFGFGLNRFLKAEITYDFDSNTELSDVIRKAQPNFTNELNLTGPWFGNQFGGYLEVQIDVPNAEAGNALDNFSGGICIPVNEEKPYHAVTARVKAPEGVDTLFTRFTANGMRDIFFSGATHLKPGKWTTIFWGTEFGYYGDTWYELPPIGIQEFCLWTYSLVDYRGSIFVDDLNVYQLSE